MLTKCCYMVARVFNVVARAYWVVSKTLVCGCQDVVIMLLRGSE